MAITDAYATAAEYRARIDKSSNADDTELDLDLEAVSRYVEFRLKRFFNIDASDITRVFAVGSQGACPPRGWRSLWITDLAAAPSSVKIDKAGTGVFTDETALASSDFELWPLNAPLGPEPKPYTRIDIPSWSSEAAWPHGARVQIVGTWGWPTVPAAIKRAVIDLTAILRIESPRATDRIPDELASTVTTSPTGQAIVRQIMIAYEKRGP